MTAMNPLYLVVPLAPLVAAVAVGLFGPKIGRVLSHTLCIAGVAVAMVASMLIARDHPRVEVAVEDVAAEHVAQHPG